MRKILLMNMINITRKRMYIMAKRHGYTHPSVVNCSQRLDVLLNKYQKF